MKYVVGFTLPYLHRLQVGIDASTPDQAIEQVQALFDSAEIWDDTTECPLLMDDFDEDKAAGAVLEFSIEQSIETLGNFPMPHSSVIAFRAQTKAQAAAQALMRAYQQGEANGGSIDWADIDAAYELALESEI